MPQSSSHDFSSSPSLIGGFRLEPGALAGPKLQDVQFFFFLCQNGTCVACRSERPNLLDPAPGVQERAFQDPEPRFNPIIP